MQELKDQVVNITEFSQHRIIQNHLVHQTGVLDSAGSQRRCSVD